MKGWGWEGARHEFLAHYFPIVFAVLRVPHHIPHLCLPLSCLCPPSLPSPLIEVLGVQEQDTIYLFTFM